MFKKKNKEKKEVKPEVVPEPMPDTPVITPGFEEPNPEEEKEVKLTPEQEEAQMHAENWHNQYGWIFNQSNLPGSVTECTTANLLLSVYCETKKLNASIKELQDTLIEVSKE